MAEILSRQNKVRLAQWYSLESQQANELHQAISKVKGVNVSKGGHYSE